MRGILIKGKNETVGLSAYNYYGADFTVSIFDQNKNQYIYQNLPMKESVEPVDSFSTTVSEDTPANSDTIKVASVDGLNKSDRVQIGDDIYRVIDIIEKDTDGDGTIDEFYIKIHRPLLNDITKNTEVTRVGNLALYYINLFLTKTGVFVITAKSNKFGLQHSEAIEVKEKDLETMFSEIDTNVEEGINLVKANTGWSVII